MHLAVRTDRVWAASRHRQPLALTMFAVVLAPVLCFAGGGSDLSQPANSGPLTPVRQLAIQGNFSGKKAGQWATDLSGIACIEPPSASLVRHCLVVNDENQSAQFATITKGKLVVGSEVKLIGAGPSSSTVGSQPTVSCPNGEAAFEEFDGEGVSYSRPYFYVVGSHGCSRNKGKFRLSSFLLARIRVDDQARVLDVDGAPVRSGTEVQTRVETTYRLTDALRKIPEIGTHFGKDLNSDNGLNVEGIAIMGNALILGLRAPSVDGKAFLVGTRIVDLFAPGAEPLSSDPEVVPLALGENRGIRDLASLPGGKLLVLAGPAQEQNDVPYSLFVVEPRLNGAVTALGSLAPATEGNKQGKAEGATVLAADAKELHLLILFDGLENGGAREYHVPLVKQRARRGK